MSESRNLLKHELLNIITVLDFYLQEEYETRRKEILELNKLAGLFIRYEHLILGEKPHLFLQNTSLRELLEIIVGTYATEFENQNIKIRIPTNEYIVKTDKNYLLDALSYLFAKIVQTEQNDLSVDFDSKQQKLTIGYAQNIPLNLSTKPLLQKIQNSKLNSTELGFEIALLILQHLQIEVSSSNKKLSLFFR